MDRHLDDELDELELELDDDGAANAHAELVIELLAGINLGVRKHNRALNGLRRAINKAAAQPATVGLDAAGVFTAPALALALGSPAMGTRWYVRSLAVGGLTPTTSAPGRADVYIGPDVRAALRTGLEQIGLAGWRDQAPVLPNVSTHTRGELTVLAGQYLTVVIAGGTDGQDYVATAAVEVFPDAAQPGVIAQ